MTKTKNRSNSLSSGCRNFLVVFAAMPTLPPTPPKNPLKNLNLQAKLTAITAILAVLIIMLQQLTDIGKAFQSFWSVWSQNSDLIENPKNIGLYETITDDVRFRNLKIIANELNQQNPAILGVAYYKLETNRFGETKMIYNRDAEIDKGEQTYFVDQVLKPEEIDKLRRQDCLRIAELGSLVDREKDDKFHAIVCPTITQSKDPVTNIVRNVTANASAIAFNPNVYKRSEDIPLEPYSTALFELSPSLENATSLIKY